MPRASPSWLVCTIRSRPNSRAVLSRKAIMSRNFQVVSTCSSGNGGFAGQNALRARCSSTVEVLADGIEQHRRAELRRGLAEDVDALGFEQLEMRGERGHAALPSRFGFMCSPHSFFSSFSHHQRPARGCSPGCTARVQGAQPIETKPRACSGFTGMLLAAI